MAGGAFNQTNWSVNDPNTWRTYTDGNFLVLQQLGAAFMPSQSSPAAMTITIAAGLIFIYGSAPVSQAAQTCGTITAPVSHPRIDRAVIDSVTGALSIITGTEAVSPSAPSIPFGKLPICQIALAVGQSTIINANITDERCVVSYIPPQSSVRQTVQSGPVDTNGLPTFLPATATGLNITSQNITSSVPFIVSAAGGSNFMGEINRIGISITNLTWSGLVNNTTNYLCVQVNSDGTLSTSAVILAPVYEFGGTPSITLYQTTYNIQQGIMYLGNGSSAVPLFIVFVGEAITSGGNVSSVTMYAYNGRYDSGWTATLPSAGAVVAKNHNIGIAPEFINTLLKFKCTTIDSNYAVGDIYTTPMAYVASSLMAATPQVTGRNTMQIVAGSGGGAWRITDKTGGGADTPTAADWSYKMMAQRSF